MNLQKDPFGLLAFLHWNHDWNNYHFNEKILPKAVKQIQELGIRLIRMDILWSDVDRGPDPFHFDRYDDILKQLQDHGIEGLAVLQYNKIDRDKEGKEIWNRPPEDFEEFARYVHATVQHFKSKIHFWEIWNEPNHPLYWAPPPDGLQLYSQLLKTSYAAAKKADPQCRVLNGGLTEPIVADLENLYLNGGKEFTDIINIHTFIDPHRRDRIDTFSEILNGVKRVMKKYGDDAKPVWITEMGCPGVREDQMPKRWFAGEGVTEKGQSEWLETLYQEIKKFPGVEKLFWAFYRDTDGKFKDATDNLGLVRADLTPKPAFSTLQRLILEHARQGK